MGTQKRTNDVMTVAAGLFLARGFEDVTLESIVSQTGGSLRDLYREFGSKQELFLRVMQGLCEEVIAPLAELGLLEDNNLLPPLEQVLSSMAQKILETLLSPHLLALHRLIVGESKRFPALGKQWYEAGPNSANRAIAAVLARYAKDLDRAEDPCLLAGIFLDSLINNLQLRALTGTAVSKADIEQRVRTCVVIFLDGIRRKAGTTETAARRRTV